MTIKLTIGKPSYSLYNKDTDQYIYFDGGDYSFSGVPKPSGMMKTYEKIVAKKARLIENLKKWSTEGRWAAEAMDLARRFPSGPMSEKQMSQTEFDTIKARRVDVETDQYLERLEIANGFVYVRIGVDYV
jgi:hypothetical protein